MVQATRVEAAEHRSPAASTAGVHSHHPRGQEQQRQALKVRHVPSKPKAAKQASWPEQMAIIGAMMVQQQEREQKLSAQIRVDAAQAGDLGATSVAEELRWDSTYLGMDANNAFRMTPIPASLLHCPMLFNAFAWHSCTVLLHAKNNTSFPLASPLTQGSSAKDTHFATCTHGLVTAQGPHTMYRPTVH